MSDKKEVTFEVAATIDNNIGLYDALQRKFKLAMFRQHKSAPIAYFADIPTDAKQTAKYQNPSIDLRYFSPVLMAENLMSLKYFSSSWLGWAIWKRTAMQMKAQKGR